MQYVTLRIPVVDAGGDPEARRRKLLEEIDEFLNEACAAPINESHMLAEFYDVAQCVFGYLVANAKQFHTTDTASTVFAASYMHNANEQHLEKIRNYAADRGWRIF